MTWINFLHFYQPPTQFPEIVKKITKESYLPILKILEKSKSKAVININASLTEQLIKQGLEEIILRLKGLATKKKIELTQSAAYHSLLPKLSKIEQIRQIKLNNLLNRHYFGEVFQSQGFFPPEMAIDNQTLQVIADLGFKWVVLDQSACNELGLETIYSYKTLKIFFRNNALSTKIAFAQTKNWKDFEKLIDISRNGYFVTAMDAETFGHHRPEMIFFLKEALEQTTVNFSLISDLPENEFQVKEMKKIAVSSWGVFGDSDNPFANWDRKDNEIQQMLWQLNNMVVSLVTESKYNTQELFNRTLKDIKVGEGLSSEEERWMKARNLLDKAVHSDQYWWASGRPRWHFQMVKKAVDLWGEVVNNIPDIDDDNKEQVSNLCQRIIKRSLELYGDRVIEP